MNFHMLMLMDCIGYPSEEIPDELIDQIKNVGEIQEVRAVAYKSLSINHSTFTAFTGAKELNQNGQLISISDLNSNPSISNNLFIFWLVYI